MAGGDWRAWLAERVGRAACGVQPPAHLAASALDAPAGGTWFATPVALVAALDHVRMPASGWLTLTAPEAAEIAAQFSREFGGSGLSLVPAGTEGFLLTGLAAGAVRTYDPARALAADIGPWLPVGEGATALRRLGTEIEMWLYEHPANRARVRRGAAPVSALWLWGGGEPADAALPEVVTREAARRTLPRGYGGDSWMRGLWRAADCPFEGEARSLAEVELAASTDTVVVARQGVDDEVVARWCEPALAHLAARRASTVQFVIDERVFRFSRFDLVKPWRRTVHWAVPT